MAMCRLIDITFDFRSDTPPEKDPDKYSATLPSYHKLLWSKSLPVCEEKNAVVRGIVDELKAIYDVLQSAEPEHE